MLALLNKCELDRLIKYGTIVVPESNTTSSNNDFVSAVNHLLMTTEPFDITTEKILLQYSPAKEKNRLDIIAVERLMPIDENGLNHYSQYQNVFPIFQIDRITLNSITQSISKRYCEQNCRNGIHIFRKYCNLNPYPTTEFEEIIVEGVLTRISHKHYEVMREKRTQWNMLLAYNRYEPYENGFKGYFLDIVEIMCYLKHPEVGFQDQIVENKKSTIAIRELKDQTKMVDELEKDERSKKLMVDVKEKYGSIYIPLLFLYMKEQLLIHIKNDDSDKVKVLLSSIKKQYPEEFEKVISLVGGFMGYENLRKICLGKSIEQIEQPAQQTKKEKSKTKKEPEPEKQITNSTSKKDSKKTNVSKTRQKTVKKSNTNEDNKTTNAALQSSGQGEQLNLFNIQSDGIHVQSKNGNR